MGIQGLLQFLKDSSVNCHVKELSGQTVAVDAYCWLHKGAFSCADKLVKGEKTDAYVTYCMKLVNMLLSHGVRPIMVFDGQPLPSKLGTEIQRRENRERNKMQAREYLRQGKTAEARKCFQKCVNVDSQMALQLMKACRGKRIDCIVAPYEADAQLAYLSQQGIADVVITEDSDLLAFGCSRVLFKMDMAGNGVLIEQSKIHQSLGNRAEFFNAEKFRRMCILSGCDYLPSLPGIGLGKAFKFFSRSTDADLNAALCRIPGCLNMPQLEVSQEYREGFLRAEQTFLHQLVYDPMRRKLIPLNPYPEGADPAAFSFAGSFVEDELAFQLALGNLDVDTHAKLDDFHPDKMGGTAASKRISIWSGNYVKAQPAVRSPEEPSRPVMAKTVRTNVEFRLPPPVISDQALTDQYAPAPAATSPVLGSRKRKRTDENDPFESSSPLSSRTPSNPFAKLRTASPVGEDSMVTSPTGTARLVKSSVTQLKLTEADGREVVISSYFASSEEVAKLSVTDQLKKAVSQVQQGHLALPVQTSEAAGKPFKPVLLPSSSSSAIHSSSPKPAGPPAASSRIGLSRSAAKRPAAASAGGMRQLSVRDMFAAAHQTSQP